MAMVFALTAVVLSACELVLNSWIMLPTPEMIWLGILNDVYHGINLFWGLLCPDH